jgi:uncharacterized protein (UPF0335 family)
MKIKIKEESINLSELKEVAREFLDRLNTIDNELSTLKEDRKELMDEYSKKLDMKTFKAAIQVNKIKKQVEHEDTFDVFLEILEN